VPPQQSFSPNRLQRRKGGDQLVVDFELIVDDCLADLGFELRFGSKPDVQFGLEHPLGAAAHLLGSIECKIGKPEEFDGFATVVGSDCYADARAANDVLAANSNGLV
jgi:hypothetical protein